MNPLDDTHDPSLKTWVASGNDLFTDFPVQNLPFGRFRRRGSSESLRIGVAIGDQVLDLAAARLIDTDDMNALMATNSDDRRKLRRSISIFLRGDDPGPMSRSCLVPQADAEMGLPCRIGDYTDFYTSIYHATTVGKQFRPENPLLPNYKWVPIGYHGRVSSIGVSGESFPRPHGQIKAQDSNAPSVQASRRLDYELEIGVFIGKPNERGEAVSMEEAESRVFGMALFNDWTARDIQPWEYQPLGPFLSKNFASTLSPWIVTTEALAPFRHPFSRPATDPRPLPYLESAANNESGAFDIKLEVWLQTHTMREAGVDGERLVCSNFMDAYWTVAQMVAHHTVNGCNLESGDLLGTGTLSGPDPNQAGSLLELTQGGKRPISLANRESRTFLEDGDCIILRGYCEGNGARRIGFGECRGTILPALERHTRQ